MECDELVLYPDDLVFCSHISHSLLFGLFFSTHLEMYKPDCNILMNNMKWKKGKSIFFVVIHIILRCYLKHPVKRKLFILFTLISWILSVNSSHWNWINWKWIWVGTFPGNLLTTVDTEENCNWNEVNEKINGFFFLKSA